MIFVLAVFLFIVVIIAALLINTGIHTKTEICFFGSIVTCILSMGVIASGLGFYNQFSGYPTTMEKLPVGQICEVIAKTPDYNDNWVILMEVPGEKIRSFKLNFEPPLGLVKIKYDPKSGYYDFKQIASPEKEE